MAIVDINIIEDWISRVVTWNANGGNAPEADVFGRINQVYMNYNLVIEECGELSDAIDANDKVEILDALCDIFVVSSYEYYLLTVNDDNKLNMNLDGAVDILETCSEWFKDSDFLESELKDLSDVKVWKYTSCESLFDALKYSSITFMSAAALGLNIFGHDVFIEAMEAVLSSNDAKFMDRKTAIEKLDHTKEFYADRYHNIVVVEDDCGVCCYRTDNGGGKIVKPFDWAAPDLKTIIEGE